jgi:hypothetical protein
MKSKVIDKEKLMIVEALHKNGKRAYNKARAAGFLRTVQEGKTIYRVSSDGRKEIVAKMDKVRYKVVQREYRLKKCSQSD